MTAQLPKDWQYQSLGAVCTKPQYGWTTKADREHGEVRLLRTTDITSGEIDWDSVPYCTEVPVDLEKYQLRPNDIVISRAGSVGASYLIRNTPVKSVFASYLIRFCPKETVEPKYVAYFLQTSDYWNSITERSVGIAVPNVNATKLETIQIPVAPQSQQKLIVGKIEELFSDLDAGVAALKRAQANLKRYRAAVLKAAVEGRLTAQWRAERKAKGIDTEPAAKLLERILAERRKKWEAAQLKKYADAGKAPPKGWQGKYPEPVEPDSSGLSKLPEGWCWANVDLLSVVVRGASPRPAGDPQYFGGNEVPWITVGEITKDDAIYLNETSEFVTEAGKLASRWIDVDTLLLTNSGATLGVPKITMIGGCINDGSVALLHVEYPLKLYLYVFLTGQTKRLRQINQGAAQPNLNTTIVKEIAVSLPPEVEQTEIVSQVEAKLSNIAQAETEIKRSLERAARLRQAILKRAFEGRLV